MEPISIGLPIPTNADLRLRHYRLFNIDRLGHIQNFEGRNCEVRFTFDSVAKLGGSRLQSLFVIFDRPLFALSL
jgi:hypothetical protein